MMPEAQQPILERLVPPKGRKYGRHDFQRFDRASSHASIGYGTFNKVKIDCRFLFTKSQWGLLGNSDIPAGIVYLDLTFDQPKDSILDSATVTVTLEEYEIPQPSKTYSRSSETKGQSRGDDDQTRPSRYSGRPPKTSSGPPEEHDQSRGGGDDQCYASRHTGPISTRPSYGQKRGANDDEASKLMNRGPQMSNHFGPKDFTGPERYKHKKKTLHLTPNAQFGIAGFGGLGFERSSTHISSSRWTFRGTLLNERDSWTYKSLKWELTENDLDSQASHSNTMHTAFAFEHTGRPFLVRVTVDGKLRKAADRLKNRLMKFPSRSLQDENTAVTLVNFGESFKFEKPLDELAGGLEYEMHLANTRSNESHLQSSPRLAQFDSSAHHETSTPGSYPLTNDTATIDDTKSTLSNATGPEPRNLDPTEPTLHNLTLSLAKLQAPLPHQKTNFIIPTQIVSMHTPDLKHNETARTDDHISKYLSNRNHESPSEEEMLLHILRVPGLLMFLKLLASILSVFGQAENIAKLSKYRVEGTSISENGNCDGVQKEGRKGSGFPLSNGDSNHAQKF